MKKVLALFFIIFVVLVTVSLVYIKHTDNRSNAASTSVYWGAFLENPWSGILPFEDIAGKPMSLVMFFHYWTSGNFPTQLMQNIRDHGSIPVVSWQSFNGSGYEDSSWGRIAQGGKDDYIRQWARDSKAWGHPYFLRFNWEMNGFWEPYSSQSEQYVPMWRHVYDIFREEGVTNVTWVWCPNVESYATKPIDEFFPGNEYVDWVCMDGYNFGTSQSGSTWQSFYDFFAATYNKLGRLAPGKPIMIGEFASSETGGDKAVWITDALRDNLPVNYPNVKAIVWFDINKETDWRVASSNNARAAFIQAISSSYYAENSFNTLSSSPIQPLTPLGSAVVQYTPPTAVPSPTASITPSPTAKSKRIPPITNIPKECTPAECGNTIDTRLLIGVLAGILLLVTSLILLIARWRIKKRRR